MDRSMEPTCTWEEDGENDLRKHGRARGARARPPAAQASFSCHEVGADMGGSLLFQQGASDRPFVNPVTSWSFLVTGESTWALREVACALPRAHVCFRAGVSTPRTHK